MSVDTIRMVHHPTWAVRLHVRPNDMSDLSVAMSVSGAGLGSCPVVATGWVFTVGGIADRRHQPSGRLKLARSFGTSSVIATHMTSRSTRK